MACARHPETRGYPNCQTSGAMIGAPGRGPTGGGRTKHGGLLAGPRKQNFRRLVEHSALVLRHSTNVSHADTQGPVANE